MEECLKNNVEQKNPNTAEYILQIPFTLSSSKGKIDLTWLSLGWGFYDWNRAKGTIL